MKVVQKAHAHELSVLLSCCKKKQPPVGHLYEKPRIPCFIWSLNTGLTVLLNTRFLMARLIIVTALHYVDTPMQFTLEFNDCKNDNYPLKNCDMFLIFALKHRLRLLRRF